MGQNVFHKNGADTSVGSADSQAIIFSYVYLMFCLCTTRMQVPGDIRRKSQITWGCEPQCWCSKSNSGPLVVRLIPSLHDRAATTPGILQDVHPQAEALTRTSKPTWSNSQLRMLSRVAQEHNPQSPLTQETSGKRYQQAV